MSKELGPGTRVWIGWSPESRVIGPSPKSSSCSTGTVQELAVAKGYHFKLVGDDRIFHAGEDLWTVQKDDGEMVHVFESLLFPIDGGEPVEKTENDKVEEEA